MMPYGTDITRDDNPYELGFDRLVDLKQEAQFIGKAALKRIKAEGVKRRFVGMEILGDPLAASNEDYWPACRQGDELRLFAATAEERGHGAGVR